VDLRDLQAEHRVWLTHNFPTQKSHQPLLGLAEEVGELCHAHLKAEQNIRGYEFDTPRWRAASEDAVGDIVIYLASYCTSVGIDLDRVVGQTWHRVKARDWVADPLRAGE
jgi:NTP pyrophosphatase (non-canonical NTP hydrolase)